MDLSERFRVNAAGELVTDGPGYFWSENEPAFWPFRGDPEPVHGDMVPDRARIAMSAVSDGFEYWEDYPGMPLDPGWAASSFESLHVRDTWLEEAIDHLGEPEARRVYLSCLRTVLDVLGSGAL